MTKEQFIEKAIKKHGDKYDYSLVEYVNNKTPIIVICKICGTKFTPRPDNFLNKTGCPKCGRSKANKSMSLTINEFIEKAIQKHGNKYDYSLVEYINNKTPVRIKCNKCGGIFEQLPSCHLSGNGCSICNPPHKKLTHNEFVLRLAKTHPNLEVLSEYINKDEKIIVRCKIHDYTYETTPHRLTSGANCLMCYNERRGSTLLFNINDVKQKIFEVHGDKYEYPYFDTEYKNMKSKITIICPKHGVFQQTCYHHINRKQGCPICNESHNEQLITKILNDNNIQFEREKKFDWLNNQRLDFYLPEYNIAIECQGEFHFQAIKLNNSITDYKKQIHRDEIKFTHCQTNNIPIIYCVPSHLISEIKCSYIYNKNNVFIIQKNNLIQYIESNETKNDKSLMNEKIEKIKKILL